MSFFFFSSRRRHTRSYGDWSSDVCSSDLRDRQGVPRRRRPAQRGPARERVPDLRHGDRRTVTQWPRASSQRSDRKSTRLNSSHRTISYAVFCLKKKKIRQVEDELGEVTMA